jgi:uncharacterized repeat protein (TIGR01451 family)
MRLRPNNPAARTHRLSRLSATLLAAAAPAAVWAVCSCGFGDGQFTTVSINVNGNTSDWAAVHADVDNNVCDGPANGLTDLDAPVQSTGRDLTHFAYTWDANNVYLFTERSGSASNTQTFVYYADTDNDGLMETGEPVIGVTWRGSNRRVNVYNFTYVSLAPAGDLLHDGTGIADGYTLPGSFANVPSTGNPDYSGTWGTTNGLQMEFYVTWGDLGLLPGQPFTFHVSSSNSSLGSSNFANQVDDNLSGCGGTVGSTVTPGLTFSPDRNLVGFASQTVVAAHAITNDSNASDSFDFNSVSAGNFAPTAINYYLDLDSSGSLTAGDLVLSDTTGDGRPNTPPMAPGASLDILITYDIPAGAAAGDVATVTTTAASDFQPLATDFIVDTLSIVLPPELVIDKSAVTVADPINNTNSPKAIPGATVLYTVSVSNQGAGTVDADTTVVLDAIPDGVCLVVTDFDGIGPGPVDFEDGSPSSGLSYAFVNFASTLDDLDFSSNNGASYDYEPTANGTGCDPAVTDIRINPKGTFAADTGSGSPQFEVSFYALVN